jgi:hypothetical protein
MPERDGYIPGVPCWIDTSHPDPQAAVPFYSGLFGWECELAMPTGSEYEYFWARIRGRDVAALGSIPQGAPPVAMWNTYVWVDDADETAAKVLDAGGTTLRGPFDLVPNGRMAVFADAERATFNVWQAQEHKGARIVNEGGSLNFNVLSTRDVQRARSFYSSVFGWRTLAVEGGAEMWTLPGYGDHLEESTPNLRRQMAEMGAPAGFEDVVASINAIGDDQPHVPAHWSVTFAVDDADAIAAKATGLGGKVVMPPFDAPWVRTAVIADPQGATFMASQFVPENRNLARQTGASTSAA